MQVILLQRVVNLGKLGETVDVKAGYGRNYLIPQGKALPAIEAKELAEAKARAEALADVNVIMRAKVGDEGKLFGSIGTRDIADALTKSGLPVDRVEVKLPEGSFRQVGEYKVTIQLHHDISADILVTILSEDAQATTDEDEA